MGRDDNICEILPYISCSSISIELFTHFLYLVAPNFVLLLQTLALLLSNNLCCLILELLQRKNKPKARLATRKV